MEVCKVVLKDFQPYSFCLVYFKMKQIPCNIYFNLLENALIGHSSNELPGGLNLAESALQSANQEDSSDCTKR